MLNCVYHFNGDMQVVDNYQRDTMIATGAWFDHPLKAKAYKAQLEEEIRHEQQQLLKKPKHSKSKVGKEN